jgi:FAD/FMN-containing dehydrogenase
MNKELAKIGFCYPTHPLNFAPISFGSEVSKNSMGEVGGMYGHIAKRLIALEVVLGNGDVLVTGSSRVIENAPLFLQSGLPDLTQLFVASEGAYGVITEVTMAMQMLPVAWLGLDVSFEGTVDGFKAAVDAVNELRTRKGIIANAHLIDWYTMWAIERGLPGKKFGKIHVDKADGEAARQKYGHIAILEIESFVSEEECRLKQEAIVGICKKYGGKHLGAQMANAFKSGERGDTGMMKILFNEYSPWVCFDSDVPYPSLGTFYEKGLEIIDRNGWPREQMGHVYAMGDESCLPFFWTLQDVHDPQKVEKAKDIAWQTMEMQVELGVVPYRIGRIWRPFVMDKIDPTYLKYIRSIKRQYDPNNIMNPGVSVFEEVY